ncbi:MAG: hypothetical protein WCQ72_00980 [Eubacteriales bacterium]
MRFLYKTREYGAVFAIGGTVYSLLEIMWRGYTHWSMALTGGFCFGAIYYISAAHPTLAMWRKCLRGAAVITASEFTVGMLVNRALGWHVWDYSGVPYNICGQICPLYSLLWFFLCIPAYFICGRVRNILHRT